MFIAWAADTALQNPAQETYRLPPDQVKPPFLWPNVCAFVQCPLTSALVFSVYFPPRLHWMDVYVDTSDFSKDDQVHRNTTTLDDGTQFTLDYEAQKRFDVLYGGLMLYVTIISIELYPEPEHYELAYERFIEAERHKIVCMCVHNRGAQRVYLGRAQHIVTTSHASNGARIYTWETLDNESTGQQRQRVADQWDKHVKDAWDLQQIRRHVPTSPRLIARGSYVPDNDDFSNANRVLPISVMRQDTCTLQFYNLKFDPPRFVETHIRWPSTTNVRRASIARLFRATPTVPYKTEMAPHLNLDVHYRVSGNYIELLQIRLQADHYLATLDKMGNNLAPNTI